MTNLKAFSTKIALQHPDNRCTLSITYGIKNFIDLTSMIYFHLKNRALKLRYAHKITNTNSLK